MPERNKWCIVYSDSRLGMHTVIDLEIYYANCNKNPNFQ